MSGGITYKDSLRLRLNIIHPGRQQITQFITNHPPRLTEGVRLEMKLIGLNSKNHGICACVINYVETFCVNLKIKALKLNVSHNEFLTVTLLIVLQQFHMHLHYHACVYKFSTEYAEKWL